MRVIALLTVLFAAGPCACSAGPQRPTTTTTDTAVPFPFELALGIRTPSRADRLALSPDGRHVAYTIEQTAGGGSEGRHAPSGAPEMFRGLRLHVVDTTNGRTDWVSTELTTAWAASWSPDGKTVAFYADDGHEVGLWRYRVGDDAAHRLGRSVVGAFHHMRPEWTPDGTEILVPTIPAAARRSPEPATVVATDTKPTARAVAAPAIVVRSTGREVTTHPMPAPTPEPPATRSTPAVQSLVRAPAVALSAVDADDGRVTEVLPAGDRPEFVAAKLSPSGRFAACERSLRAVFGDGLKVLLDLSLVRRSDGATLHRIEGMALDVNIDPTAPTLAAMAWHPTQDRLAYLHAGRLVLVDVTTATPLLREVPLAAHAASAERVQFSADGSMLLVSVRAADAPAEDPFLARILVIPTTGGPPGELLPPDSVRLRGVIGADWRTAWQPEPDRIVAAGTDLRSGEAVFVHVPLDATPATIHHRVAGRLHIVGAVARGQAVALVETASTAPDYFLLGPDFAPTQRLSRAEPRLDAVQVGPFESLATEIGTDGGRRTVHAVLALPPGGKRGDRFPTIVTCYPGQEQSREARAFGGGNVASIPAAVLTTRGYAVLVLDVPLAPFGVPSDPLRDTQAAVLPQVRQAIELGYTDGERVGVLGHSYGAYGAACLLCGTHAFRAAVAISGSYDLAGIYGAQRPDEPETAALTMNMLYLEQHQGRMGRRLWDEPQRYLANSPYFQADRIHTPLLLLHGRADTNCSATETEKLFNAIKRLGGDAQVALYEGEGHDPAGWSSTNRLDLAKRVVAFFDRHLKRGNDQGR